MGHATPSAPGHYDPGTMCSVVSRAHGAGYEQARQACQPAWWPWSNEHIQAL